ncbi:DNA polymerase V family protein [Cavenderia fasciculata]|uniref:DNA polymerase V family protein n=1 Tax=Cavenderia fasciculata TaxID=261658 RepID=F4PTQ8_CACFS|nr:DNA polymerase V family protein [Cavenderia fasciculata]EGG21728.1 DNA polymerase V family protein [Cavenderia fasciculata]|eukprot:XP_004359578.1 DNA polymerase V family protein [Cavenderia fasciculata]
MVGLNNNNNNKEEEGHTAEYDAYNSSNIGTLESMKHKDTILQCFYDIISADEGTRINGVSTLVSTLSDIQKKFNPADRRDLSKYASSSIGRSKVANEKLTIELNYSLKRLVYGLASSRELTKMGFSLALGELINALPEIDIGWMFDFIMHTLDITGRDLSERESHYGRLFALMALIRSGRIEESYKLVTEPTNSFAYNGNTPSSEHIVEAIIEQLIFISRKRAIYVDLSYELLVSVIELLDESNLPILWSHIKTLIPEKIDDYSPELLSLLYFISARFSSFDITKSCKGWSNKSIFHQSNLKLLKNIYSETVKSHPRVHKIWKLTINALVQGHKENASLIEFWNVVVENNLFRTSSNMKKYLGLQLFEMLLPMIPTTSMKFFFTKNVIYYLNDSLKTDSALHEIGSQVFQGIAKVAEISQTHRLELIYFFSINHDKLHDRQVPVDVITALVRDIDAEHVAKYTEFIIDSFYNAHPKKGDVVVSATEKKSSEESDETEEAVGTQNMRSWAILQLNIVAKDSIKRPTSFIVSIEQTIARIAKFFYFNAFYNNSIIPPTTQATPSKKKAATAKTAAVATSADPFDDKLITRVPEYPIGHATRASCVSKFYSILEELTTLNLAPKTPASKDDTVLVNPVDQITGVTETGELWISFVYNFQSYIFSRPEPRPLTTTFLPSGLKPIEKVTRIISQLHAIPMANRSVHVKGFELLFTHIALQYVVDPMEISEFVDDLVEAYEDLTSAAAKAAAASTPAKKKAAAKAAAAESDKPSALMVLIDILISLLDHSSSLHKTVVKQIFGIFSDQMTMPAFEHIINIITTPIDDIFDQNDNGEADDDDEDDDLEIVSGDEMDIDENGQDNEENEDDDDDEEEEEENQDDDEEEEEEEDSDDDDKVDPEFVARLKKQLAGHLLLEEDDDDSLDPPTEEQAKQLDKSLAAVFKNKKEKKSNFQDLKSKSLNLKIRLIDLIDQYIKKYSNVANPLVFELLPRLIEASLSEDPTISNKMVSLFKNRVGGIKSMGATVPAAVPTKLMNICFDRLIKAKTMSVAERSAKPFQFVMAAHTIYMAIKVLQQANKFEPAALTRRLKEVTEKKLILDKGGVSASFLAEFASRYPQFAWDYVPKLLNYIKEGCPDFCIKKFLSIINSLVEHKEQHGTNGDLYLKQAQPLFASVIAVISSASLKSRSVFDILATLTAYVTVALTYVSVEKFNEIVDAYKLENHLSAMCDKHKSQAQKEASKKILRLLQVESDLLEAPKRKRKGKTFEHSYLTVDNAQRGQANPGLKIDNKLQHKKKKRFQDIDEGAQLYSDIANENMSGKDVRRDRKLARRAEKKLNPSEENSTTGAEDNNTTSNTTKKDKKKKREDFDNNNNTSESLKENNSEEKVKQPLKKVKK